VPGPVAEPAVEHGKSGAEQHAAVGEDGTEAEQSRKAGQDAAVEAGAAAAEQAEAGSGAAGFTEDEQSQEVEESQEPEDVDEAELDEVELMLQLGVQLEARLQEAEAAGLPPDVVMRCV
jgi:hypothetical protein